ncbi:MAG: leucine-rich repeat protein [Candidatus Gastranaerophilaceae bacterium]
MVKKIAAATLAAVLAFGGAAVAEVNLTTDLSASAASVTASSVDYKYSVKNNQVTLTKYLKSSKNVVIPSTIGGKKVTAIASDCFKENQSIERVVLSKNVKTIGQYAFAHCTKLKSVSLPTGVEYIGTGAFGGCTALESVAIPSSVKTINSLAFAGCKKLKRITVSGSNKYFTSVSGILYNKSKTQIKCCPMGLKLSSFSIPKGVKEIEMGAFAGQENLKSVKFPSTLKTIGTGAFGLCPNLKSVAIPQTITKIGNLAFGYTYDKAKAYEFAKKGFSKGFATESKYAKKIKNFTIKGYVNSAAEKYAKTYGFTFSKVGIASVNVKPVSKVISPSTKSVTVAWSKVNGVDGYNIYKYSTAKKKYVKVKTTKSTNFTTKSLTVGAANKYIVKAYIKVGSKQAETTVSNVTLTVRPKKPTTLKATAGKKKAALSWSKVSGVNGYKVYQKVGKKYKLIAKTKKTSFTKTKLTSKKTYKFAVQTYKKIGSKYYYSDTIYKTVKVK